MPEGQLGGIKHSMLLGKTRLCNLSFPDSEMCLMKRKTTNSYHIRLIHYFNWVFSSQQAGTEYYECSKLCASTPGDTRVYNNMLQYLWGALEFTHSFLRYLLVSNIGK